MTIHPPGMQRPGLVIERVLPASVCSACEPESITESQTILTKGHVSSHLSPLLPLEVINSTVSSPRTPAGLKGIVAGLISNLLHEANSTTGVL